MKIEKIIQKQNLLFAIIASFGTAIVMAALWAVVTVITQWQIGYMAIAVGFAVGFAVRYAGKGVDQVYGVIGAIGALFGCILGNFFTQVGFIAEDPEFIDSYFEIAKILLSDMSLTMEIMIESFHIIDLLFYGIAISTGYRYSFIISDNNVFGENE